MSSYNENLYSNVVASLQAQELELKKVKAKKNANMFTLYYAEGATLKASEELENTLVILGNKGSVKAQAVANSNISNNLLDSASQAGVYVKQSITNSSVSAANVQLAANAIVRLASDLGSIYGILNAADSKSDMYVLAEESRRLINKTAYDAELASQTAMEASILTSEVTASTVQDKSKANNDLMNSVLKVTSDEFNAVSQLAIADNATLAGASSLEKSCESDYLDITVDYKSSKTAYKATNKGLNLGLSVTGKSSTGFTVEFESIKMPFKHLQDAGQAAANPPNPYYPIKNYYFILVKDKNKSTFSISNAENLLISDSSKTSLTNAPANNTPNQTTDTNTPQSPPLNPTMQIIPLQIPLPGVNTGNSAAIQSNPTTTVPAETDKKKQSLISQVINFQEMLIDNKLYTIQDADGDFIKLGTRYVVFVLALYTDDYKKKINCFDEFLSAPSPSFKLTNKLVAAEGSSITFSSLQIPGPGQTSVNYDYLMNFTVAENLINAGRVEYRCIFLPPNDPWAGALLNSESTLALNQQVESLEAIAEEFDPQIASVQASIIDSQNYLGILNARKASLSPNVIPGNTEPVSAESTSSDASVPDVEQEQLNAVILQINAQTDKLTAIQSDLTSLIAQKDSEIDKIKNGNTPGNIEFLFNLKIAEQVLAGNYIVAKNPTLVPIVIPANPTSKKTKNTASDSISVSDAASAGAVTSSNADYPLYKWDVEIKADATDNFGSPLNPGLTYKPVILSYCTAEEENLAMFSNNWSGYNSSTPFYYKMPATIIPSPVSPISTSPNLNNA